MYNMIQNNMQKPNLSFIIPAKDEERSVAILYKEIIENVKKTKKSFEIIFVEDGSTDNTFEALKKIRKRDNRVKIIKLRGNFGKSVALQLGFRQAKGRIIITMDADLQDNPKEIPLFLKKLDQGNDMVVGWKKKRYDPPSKTIPSKLGNYLTRVLTGVKIHDLNCGFKAFKSEVTKDMNLYGELYKYIPILAAKKNFKTTEITVRHRPRKYGKSKYGWERNVKGLLDLITVVFLTGYLRRPGHFFGTMGLISFFFGFLIGVYITYLRITTGSIQYRHPLLFLGMLLMIIGVQLVSTGLLAELNIHSKRSPDYSANIEQILGGRK